MGRLVTFVVGILVGVVLKWQYDQQPSAATSPQSTERNTSSGQSVGAVQEIAITVEPSRKPPPAMPKPAPSTETPAISPDEG